MIKAKGGFPAPVLHYFVRRCSWRSAIKISIAMITTNPNIGIKEVIFITPVYKVQKQELK